METKILKQINNDTSQSIASFGITILALAFAGYFGLTGAYLLSAIVFFIFFASIIFQTSLSNETNKFNNIILIISIYFLTKLNLHEFILWIGDASAYLLDANEALLIGHERGFFPPASAAVSGVSAYLSGISGGAWAHVGFYLVPILLLYFYLHEKINVSSGARLLVISVFLTSPLVIWFSKSNFSEPIWHFIALSLVGGVSALYGNNQIPINKKSWLILLAAILFFAPLVRGTAIFAMAFVYFVAFFHISKFKSVPTDIFILSLAFMGGILLALELRSGYYVGWQLSSIVEGVSLTQWKAIFCMLLVAGVAFSFMFDFARRKYSRLEVWSNGLSFYWLAVVVLLFIKLAIAYWLIGKVEFLDAIAGNELSFLVSNFGILISILVVLGLARALFLAASGDSIALIVLAYYVFMSLPLMFTGLHADKSHDLYLYWSRYYFSDVMLAHVILFAFSISWIFQIISKFSSDNFNRWSLGIIIIVFSIYAYEKGDHIRTVILESNMRGVNQYISDLILATQGEPVYAVYDNDIRYGGFDASQFIGRSLKRLGVNIQHEQIFSSSDANSIYSKLINDDSISLSEKKILCMSSNMNECEKLFTALNHEHQLSGVFPYISQGGGNVEYSQRLLVLNSDIYSFGGESLHFIDGWHKREIWGRWSSGLGSKIGIILPKPLAKLCNSLRIEGRTFVPRGEEVTLTVVSEEIRRDIQLTNSSRVTVDVPLSDSGETLVNFFYTENYKVSDYTSSRDGRRIVFGFENAQLIECSINQVQSDVKAK